MSYLAQPCQCELENFETDISKIRFLSYGDVALREPYVKNDDIFMYI